MGAGQARSHPQTNTITLIVSRRLIRIGIVTRTNKDAWIEQPSGHREALLSVLTTRGHFLGKRSPVATYGHNHGHEECPSRHLCLHSPKPRRGPLLREKLAISSQLTVEKSSA